MSDLPHMIIITGWPCTGKTTLARQISEYLRLPLLNKDLLKETLFDTLGWSNRDWSQKLGLASIELLFKLLETQLAAGKSCLVESNFDSTLDSPRFQRLHAIHRYRALQIHCQTRSTVLGSRFKQRADSGQRHPGHGDQENYAEFVVYLERGVDAPLALDGPIISLNTTDLGAIDYPGLYAAINLALEEDYAI